MIKKVGTMIKAVIAMEAFDEAVEDQTRKLTKEVMEMESKFVGYDMDNEEHAKEITSWIQDNPKYDFMALKHAEDLSIKLVVLEKGTDKFVAGRKVIIKDIEKGSITIGGGSFKPKDGVDPYEFGKSIRESTEEMEEA